jgi:predicted nucleic acid-binding protein
LSLLYADSSALARAYFADEPEHDALRTLLLDGTELVITSEIARLELASALRAASSNRRFRRWTDFARRIDRDLADGGPIAAIDLRAETIFPVAHRLILEHRLRTLDAIHLAVCAEEAPALAGGEEIVFVTRDNDQANAARSMGFAVR